MKIVLVCIFLLCLSCEPTNEGTFYSEDKKITQIVDRQEELQKEIEELERKRKKGELTEKEAEKEKKRLKEEQEKLKREEELLRRQKEQERLIREEQERLQREQQKNDENEEISSEKKRESCDYAIDWWNCIIERDTKNRNGQLHTSHPSYDEYCKEKEDSFKDKGIINAQYVEDLYSGTNRLIEQSQEELENCTNECYIKYSDEQYKQGGLCSLSCLNTWWVTYQKPLYCW